jgi:glutathione synthase
MKPVRLGVVMDPIGSINYKKDSTLAMLLEAQARGYEILYMQPHQLYLNEQQARAHAHPLKVMADPAAWFELGEPRDTALATLDVILMRKDPPFDMDYIYTTYLLELAEQAGSLVVNRPQGLRDANEKLFTCQFPQCLPPTLVSAQAQDIKAFIEKHQDIILKPLDTMGGASIFRVRQQDPNLNVIIETLTHEGRRQIMAQRFIPEVSEGDKRILLVDGEPVPYALARIPASGETRANLARGASSRGIELSERDRWICQQVAPVLRDKGLVFVGLDVIGDYLTEINVTSPTCIRELDIQYNINVSAMLFDKIEQQLQKAA